MIRVTNVGYPSTPPVMLTEETPAPHELAAAKARRATFLKNLAWAGAHAGEIRRSCAGKFICVAGEQLFVADAPRQAHDLARTAHPAEADATFSMYVPETVRPKIYAR